MQKFLFQLLMILLVTFVLGEAALRIFNHYNPLYVFYSGSYNRFRGQPYSEVWGFKLNSQGFHDTEFGAFKEKYRILAVGDSFSFGVVPYRFNYLTLLESLEVDKNPGLELFNMGVPSTGPKDYLSILVKEGLAFHPDMVLVSFFIGNDFNESSKRKLYEYSYVVTLLHYMFSGKGDDVDERVYGGGTYCDDCPTLGEQDYLQIQSERSLIYLKEEAQFPKMLDRAVYYLTQMHKVCENRGIRLVVVIIPDELQVSQEIRSEVMRKFFQGVPGEQWDLTLPNKALGEELKKQGIESIDLLPFFPSDSGGNFYKPRDTHWNIAGNRLAAEVIGKTLNPVVNE